MEQEAQTVDLLGIQALTSAIYRVWYGTFDQDSALQLATVLVSLALTLVTIERAGHSWILRDPETLPAIVAELLADGLGDGIRTSLRAAGVRKKYPTLEDVEAVCYDEGARVFALTPARSRRTVVGRHRRPRYSWHLQHPGR